MRSMCKLETPKRSRWMSCLYLAFASSLASSGGGSGAPAVREAM